MPSVRLQLADTPESLQVILDSINQSQGEILRRLDIMEKLIKGNQPVDPERMYTRSEAAGLLRISVRTLDRLIQSGQLNSIRRNRRIFVLGKSIESLYRINKSDAVAKVIQL